MSQEIHRGLKFTSKWFAATAEIVDIFPDQNIVHVMLTNTQGHSWVEKDWNLCHTKWGFENKEYMPIDPRQAHIDKSFNNHFI